MKKLMTIALILVLCLCQVSALADYSDIIYSTMRVYTEIEYDAVLESYNAQTYLYVPAERIAATGTAFAVGKKGDTVKYCVTNRHVVPTETEVQAYLLDKAVVDANGTIQQAMEAAGNKYVWVEVPVRSTPYIVLTTTENMIPAYVAGYSDRADLCTLELSAATTERVPAMLRPFESIGREHVYAAGFPGAMDYMLTEDADNNLLSSPEYCSVTGGLISRVVSHAVTNQGEYILTDTPINHGNSGGPLVDEKSRVVGVNTTGWTADETQNTNGALSVNEVVRMLDQLRIPYQTAGSFDWMTVAYAAAGVVLVVLVILAVVLAGRQQGTRFMLVGIAGELRGKAFRLNKTTVLGRDKNCHIIFPDSAHGVSGRHCTITVKDNVVTVVDSSTYGTWIDKNKLTTGTPTPMKQGQTLYLGSSKQGLMLK